MNIETATLGSCDMAMDVTLRQLRAYVAVLEAASFSEAAKAMHLSQAALSGLIKELENRVGVCGRRDLCPDGAARALEPGRSARQSDQSQGAPPRAGACRGARNAVLHA